MNSYERLLYVFMNYSRIFLNNKWDVYEIHELSAWSSEPNIHEIKVVHEQTGAQVVL